MEKLDDQTRKDKLFVGILGLLYFAISFVQVLIPSIVPEIKDFTIPGFERIHFLFIFSIILSLIKLLVSIECVTSCSDFGFWVQFGLNSFSILFCIVAIFILPFRVYFSDAIFSAVTIILAILVLREIHIQNHHLGRIKNLAFIDDMTGLPNRKERYMTIEQMISGPNPSPIFTVIQFDFDNFRMMNDYLGYQIGDTFITEVAHNMKSLVKSPNSIGRIGGDEFLLILNGAYNESEIDSFISQIQGAISQPFYYKDHEYKITASFGISRYPKDATTAVQLLQQTELAMYHAKSEGKNKVMFFDEEMQHTLEYHIRFSRELQNAISRNELYVEYQPVYTASSKKLRGYEVLARWSSKHLGHVAPVNFIPLAEENGSIVDIGKWILRESCKQYVMLYSQMDEKPILSVNISVVQLRDPRFVESIEKIIDETGIDPSVLEFEVTESVCINSPAMVKHLLTELKKLGIRISLDDFGTGYSSLSYLRTLPFDIVKIDKSFIDSIGVVDDSKNIVKTIIGMAHQLDLKVIAEGVENQEQFNYLLRNGCDYVQGNLLGRPIVAAGL